jgi:SPX domain protein involved in polyphosphate accumulation
MNDLTPTPKLSIVSTSAERREYVYTTSADAAEPFAAEVARHLALDPHNLQAHDADAAHYVTTLYFDSTNHDIAHACANDDDSVKLRAREYFDRTLANEITTEPLLWFEIKGRDGANTRKLRFPIPSAEVGAFLEDGMIDERMIELQRERWGKSAEQLFEEISKLCGRTAGPLRPDCVAHYRRRAWQDQDGSTRVTLDTELAFYRAPLTVFSQFGSLSDLIKRGRPVLRADHCVIEIKLLSEQPEWLTELIATSKLEREVLSAKTFSKFLAASQAVATAEDSTSPPTQDDRHVVHA